MDFDSDGAIVAKSQHVHGNIEQTADIRNRMIEGHPVWWACDRPRFA